MFFSWFKRKNTFDSFQIEEIELGRKEGVDVSVYANSKYCAHVMKSARESLKSGVNSDSVRTILLSYGADDMTVQRILGNSVYLVEEDYLVRRFLPPYANNRTRRLDTIPSAFYGAVFGDIAGSAYEFGVTQMERRAMRLDYDSCITDVSCPTNDSVLSCATAIAMREPVSIDHSIPDYEHLSGTSSPYFENPFTDTYRKIAKQYPDAGYGSRFLWWMNINTPCPYGSFGNGAAMRVSPIAEAFSDPKTVIRKACQSAAATHNHIEGQRGAVCTSVLIWMAEHGYTKDEMFQYLSSHYKNNRAGIRSFSMTELDAHPMAITCEFSVPAAMICFLKADSFEDTISNVLSFDGDSDTIGAIAGSIAGAFYGVPDDVIRIVDERKPGLIFDQAKTVIHAVCKTGT